VGKNNDMLPTYYVRRKDKGRSIYVRMVAPTDIAALLPPKARTFRQSLLTADVKEAIVRGAPLIHSKLAEWDKIRQQLRQPQGPTVVPGYLTGAGPNAPDEVALAETRLTPQLISNLVAARMHAWVRLDERERPTLDDVEFAEVEAFSQMSLPQLRRVIGRGAKSERNADLVEQVLDTAHVIGLKISEDDPLFAQLVWEFAIGEKKIHELLINRSNGNWSDAKEILPDTQTQLSEMTAVYRKRKSAVVGDHHLGTNLFIWGLLIEHKGDVFLSEVSSKDLYALMEHHLIVTKRWSDGYLTKVKAFFDEMFALAITLSFFEGPNPVEDLKVLPQLPKNEREGRKKPRFPTSSSQINQMLASDWYNPKATHWKGQLGHDLGTRYFMPLICVLHGPRVREPLQLMTDEIVERDGIVCFNFRIEFDEDDEKGAKKSKSAKDDKGGETIDTSHPGWPTRSFKNNAVSRVIPVHPKLLELGFMQYVEERRAELGRPGPLFQSALPQPGGASPKYGRAYEQAMLRFMKDKLNFPSGIGNHSYRHQFEDRIREANSYNLWPAGMVQFISGRRMVRDADKNQVAQEGSEKSYGKGYSPGAVARWQTTIDFSDIQFPPPYQVWKSLGR
jgi:hypothetical protein